MAMLSTGRRPFTAAQWLARLVFSYWLIDFLVITTMGACKAHALQSTSIAPSCKVQNMRFAISLSGFSWIIWPLLVWYKWLPQQVNYPVPGILKGLKYKLTNALRVLRGLLWALIFGADCWWISTGGVHQYIKEVLIAQIVCQVVGNLNAGFLRVDESWRTILRKYGEMWPDSPERDRSDLCQKYWKLCNGSETALYDSNNLTYEVILRDYPELIDSSYIVHYTPTRNLFDTPPSDVTSDGRVVRRRRSRRQRRDGTLRTPLRSSTSYNTLTSDVVLNVEDSEESRKLRERMSNVFDKYVRKESKAYKRLLEIYTNISDPLRTCKIFEDVIVAQTVSQIYGWDYLSRDWADAITDAGVQGWPNVDTAEDKEYWAISQNLSNGLYDANVVDRAFIETNCEALMDPECISKYFPGILDAEGNNSNLDEEAKLLLHAMRLIEKQLNSKVIVEDPELMEICVALGQSAASAIKKAPGFKSLRTELIKEFVQISWSKIGISLTIVYLTAGTWLYLVNNREAALQWFRSALGSGMVVLLQGTAKTSSNLKRCTRMGVLILLSIGLHALIGALDPHRYWFIRWRGLIWSSLWITWLFPMLEFKLCGKYRYGTTFVAFLTFFGRLVDGTAGVIFAIFFENQY